MNCASCPPWQVVIRVRAARRSARLTGAVTAGGSGARSPCSARPRVEESAALAAGRSRRTDADRETAPRRAPSRVRPAPSSVGSAWKRTMLGCSTWQRANHRGPGSRRAVGRAFGDHAGLEDLVRDAAQRHVAVDLRGEVDRREPALAQQRLQHQGADPPLVRRSREQRLQRRDRSPSRARLGGLARIGWRAGEHRRIVSRADGPGLTPTPAWQRRRRACCAVTRGDLNACGG